MLQELRSSEHLSVCQPVVWVHHNASTSNFIRTLLVHYSRLTSPVLLRTLRVSTATGFSAKLESLQIISGTIVKTAGDLLHCG